ncbi:hypothetical protein Ancab_013751 [Ancistrocladus abbreviatus]
MKASLKFREEQNPLFKAKIPLNILGLPFQSGFAAGDSKELRLTLGTFFDSGPSFRVSYRPNDASNPFSLIVKTGIGHFGSPIDAPMTMSAEFNLVGRLTNNPTFFLHFKPQVGDFSIKKSQTSFSANPIDSSKEDSVSDDIGVIETPIMHSHFIPGATAAANRGLNGHIMTNLPSKSTVGEVIDSALSGMELGARTVLPIRNGAVLKFRWGVKFPNDLKGLFFSKEGLGDRTLGISSRGIPLLVMNKMGIEHVARDDSKGVGSKVGPGLCLPGNGDVVEGVLAVKRQLEGLQAENGRLRQAMDDLRAEFSSKIAGGVNSSNHQEGERGRGKKNDRYGGNEKKSAGVSGFGGKEIGGGDVNGELKKALTKETGA